MKPRERVLRAFRRLPGLPDRVPIQFDLCRPLLEHFGTRLGIPVRYTNNPYEDVTYRISGNEVRTAMGSDVVVTGASVADTYEVVKGADGTWLNEYGMRMKEGPIYVEVVGHPLAHAESAADIRRYSFPDGHAPGRFRDAQDLVASYRDDYFIIGDIEVTIFTLAQQLVGMEKLMMDMATGAEYVQPLFAACAEYQTTIGLQLIQLGVDAIWAGDDFGSQNGLLFSPQMFDEMLRPHYARMNQAFRDANPDIVLALHCDGAVSRLLDTICELGYEVFNPVQPGVPGHGAQELKDGWGDRLIFWGAIDQQDLLPKGSDDELEADIRDKIRILGRNGGYMIAPAHIIQADVAPARVERFIEWCRQHGRYD